VTSISPPSLPPYLPLAVFLPGWHSLPPALPPQVPSRTPVWSIVPNKLSLSLSPPPRPITHPTPHPPLPHDRAPVIPITAHAITASNTRLRSFPPSLPPSHCDKHQWRAARMRRGRGGRVRRASGVPRRPTWDPLLRNIVPNKLSLSRAEGRDERKSPPTP
jgi:hypothetical protein